MKSITSLLVAVALLAASVTVAQDRKPSGILKPEQASILLMEARLGLEQPDKTLDFMALKEGDLVADIGAGNGWYTLRLAERIGPKGVVFAVDVQQGMLDQLSERQKEAGIKNVYPILGEFTDPLLPPEKIDWILLVDAYHEFSDPEPMLARMKESLAPGGRVALLEYRAEQDPATIPFPIPRDHKMAIEEVMTEWEPAGFELVQRVEFLPAQHLFVFKVAGDETRRDIRPMNVTETTNPSTYDHTVYFAGQPSEGAFAEYAALGVKTVINLRAPEEQASLGFDEKAIAEAAGMTYVNVPMGPEMPSEADLKTIMDALDLHTEAPVLLHCASSNRVGAVWANYVGARQGLGVEDAIAEGKAAGMRAPAFEEGVRKALGN